MHIGAACRMTLQPMGPTYTMNNCNIPLHITLLLCLSPAPFLSNALQTIVVRLGVLKKINIVILPALQMGKMKLRDITQQASGSARNRNHDPRFPVPGSNHLQWELGHGYTYKLTAAQLFRYSCATVRSLVQPHYADKRELSHQHNKTSSRSGGSSVVRRASSTNSAGHTGSYVVCRGVGVEAFFSMSNKKFCQHKCQCTHGFRLVNHLHAFECFTTGAELSSYIYVNDYRS